MRLELCPYCDEEPVLRKRSLGVNLIEYQVECVVCGACGPGNRVKEAVVTQWNKVAESVWILEDLRR